MRVLKWILVGAGFLGLILIRAKENVLFYDPFLGYFKDENFQHVSFPELEWGKLILNYVFRFVLNLICSLCVVHFLFKKVKWTLQTALIISIVFAIFLPIYLWCISIEFSVGYLFSFYVRRMVIQPVMLLLMMVVWYHRSHSEENV